MLFPAEQFWADYYEQLKDLGYRLRPRYNPSPTTQVSLEDDITLPGDVCVNLALTFVCLLCDSLITSLMQGIETATS